MDGKAGCRPGILPLRHVFTRVPLGSELAPRLTIGVGSKVLGKCFADLVQVFGEIGKCFADLAQVFGEIGKCFADLAQVFGEIGKCFLII